MKFSTSLFMIVVVFSAFAAVDVRSNTAITDIPPEGLTISESGTYYFANDINWAGEVGALTAITVKASNVILDMKGHTLFAPRNVTLSGAIGISADGANNLSLRTGKIKGFQLIGVSLANSDHVTLSKVTISDVGNGVPGYTPSGLLATKCGDLTISKVTVSNVNGSWFEPSSYGQIVSGIFLNDCINVSIDGTVNGIYGYANVVSGVFGVSCNEITLKRMTIRNVNGSAVAVSGASFGLSKNINIENCIISDLNNDAGVCSGIGMDDCQQINVLKTTVCRLSTGLTPNENAVGHTCIGMVFAPLRVVEGVSEINVIKKGALYSQLLPPTVKIDPPADPFGKQAIALPIISSEGKLEDILVLDPGAGYAGAPDVEIVPNPLWAAGDGAEAVAEFSAVEEGSASDILIENCKIYDIAGSCDDAHGISLFVVSDATIRKVTVQRVADGRGGRGAKATGIEIYGLVDDLPSNILVENCNVRDISAISPGDLQAAGFSVAGKGITFSNCKASNVTVSGSNPVDAASPGVGIGFAWAPDIRLEYTYAPLETVIKNCMASSCQVGFDTFYFQDSTWTNIRSVKNIVPIKEEPAGTVRVFFCDKASESPSAPQASPINWFNEVPVSNIASGNTFLQVKIK